MWKYYDLLYFPNIAIKLWKSQEYDDFTQFWMISIISLFKFLFKAGFFFFLITWPEFETLVLGVVYPVNTALYFVTFLLWEKTGDKVKFFKLLGPPKVIPKSSSTNLVLKSFFFYEFRLFLKPLSLSERDSSEPERSYFMVRSVLLPIRSKQMWFSRRAFSFLSLSILGFV